MHCDVGRKELGNPIPTMDETRFMRSQSSRNQELLLIHMHKLIEEAASEIAGSIRLVKLDKALGYPPNCGFSECERKAIESFRGSNVLESALRKIVASAIGTTLYHLFAIIDGIGDPPGNGWTGVSLLDKQLDDKEGLFLNIDFYDK